MRRMHVAVGMLACLLAGCADSTSTQLAPTGPLSAKVKPTPTLSVSSPRNCVTTAEWADAKGVALVEHLVDLGSNRSLGVRDSVDRTATSSTVQWNPGSFHGATGREPTGMIRAILRDHKGNELASTDWVSAGFDCIAT